MSVWDEIKADDVQEQVEDFYHSQGLETGIKDCLTTVEELQRGILKLNPGESMSDAVRSSVVLLAACAVAWIEHIDKEVSE